MSSSNPLTQLLINLLYGLSLVLIMIPVFTVAMPRIESAGYPVTEPASIERMEPDGPFSTIIYGTIKKIRDCRFVRVEWFYGERHGRKAGVKVEFLEGPKVRHAGPFSFGPWRIELPPRLLKLNSHADAVHQCRWWIFDAPYVIRSPLWR